MRATKANLVALAKGKGLTVEFHSYGIEAKDRDGKVVAFGLRVRDAFDRVESLPNPNRSCPAGLREVFSVRR